MKLARIQHIPNYVQALRQQIGLYLGYIIPPSLAQEAYEALQQDATVQHAINYLSLLAAGREWYIDPQSKDFQQVANVVEEGIRCVGDFTHARKSLGYGALYGMSLLKKKWELRKTRIAGIKGKWWVCTGLQEVDPRRLRIERDIEDRNHCYWTIWTPEVDRYIVIEDRNVNPMAETAVQDYVWYFSEFSELQAGYGLGLGHVLWTICYIKSKVLQYRAELCETWARPWLVGKLDLAAGVLTDATMGTGYSSISDRVTEVLDVLDKMRARHILVMGSEDSLEVKEAGTAADQLMNSFLGYLDTQITTLILGSSLSTQTASTHGSYAQARVHESSTDAVVAYHREKIEETLTRDLINDFIDRNKIHLIRFGKPIPGQLQFKIKDHKQTQYRLQMKKESLPIAAQLGLPLKLSEVYETLGFSVPTDKDETFSSNLLSQASQPQQGGSPGGAPSELPFNSRKALVKLQNQSDILGKLLQI